MHSNPSLFLARCYKRDGLASQGYIFQFEGVLFGKSAGAIHLTSGIELLGQLKTFQGIQNNFGYSVGPHTFKLYISLFRILKAYGIATGPLVFVPNDLFTSFVVQ